MKRKFRKEHAIIFMIGYYLLFMAFSFDFNMVSLIENGTLTGYNLIPFITIFDYIFNIQNYNLDIVIKFFLNIIYFIPLGVMFVIYENKTNMNRGVFKWVVFLILLLISDALPRVFKMGVFDIDAVILRYLGAVCTYKILKKLELRKSCHRRIFSMGKY